MSVVLFIAVGISARAAWALPLQSIDIRSGFFDGELRSQGHYKGIPLMASFNFDMRSIFEKMNVKTKGSINGCIEPFINTVMSPDPNVETGSNFLLRYVYPLTGRIQPFVAVGLGVIFMTQHVHEQSTQYNFLPQGGVGCLFFFQEKAALNVEYRFRHLSNASIKHPNSGIDVDMGLAGVSLFF